MVKQIQDFNEKQIAASKPDPIEEKRKEKAKLETAKMHQAVRNILDDMMSTMQNEPKTKMTCKKFIRFETFWNTASRALSTLISTKVLQTNAT